MDPDLEKLIEESKKERILLREFIELIRKKEFEKAWEFYTRNPIGLIYARDSVDLFYDEAACDRNMDVVNEIYVALSSWDERKAVIFLEAYLTLADTIERQRDSNGKNDPNTST